MRPQILRFALLLPVALSLAAIANGASIADFDLPSEVRIEVGKSKTVEVSNADNSELSKNAVTVQAPSALTVEPQQNGLKVNLIITLNEPGIFSVPVTVEGKTKTIKVRPIIQANNLVNDQISSRVFTVSLDAELALVRNSQRIYLVRPGLTLESSDLSVASTNDAVARPSFDGQRLMISPVDLGEPAQITIRNSDNALLKTITVTVKESPKSVRPSLSEITIDKQADLIDWFDKIKLINANGTDVTANLKDQVTLSGGNQGNLEIFQIDATKKKLRGLRQGDAFLTLTVGDTVLNPVMVHVTAKPQKATFVSQPFGSVLRPNQSTRLTATLKNGEDIINTALVTNWELIGSANALITLNGPSPEAPNTITVTALPTAGPGTATVRATFGDGLTSDFTFTIVVSNVVDFKPLQIRFDILDEQTARDLFGKKAADDFHIAKIRLFNKLRDPENLGNSILVYGESLEVNVLLEIREENSQWENVSPEKYQEIFGNENYDPPGSSSEMQLSSGNTNATTGSGRRTVAAPQPAASRPNAFSESGSVPNLCVRVHQPGFFARYRPLTFEMLANTHDRRDERSTRSRILLVMNSMSSFASFVTAIAVPGPSSDLPLGLDKFRNLLIPSFEKLFPSMKEVQRQNIVSMAMKPLEEVPFGSDITRIVFFPKKPIKGIMPRTLFRIGAISMSDACSEVGIIKKAGQQ